VYEIFVKWYPSNAHDNSESGYTGETLIDCYRLDGTRLWQIDLGKNIRSGAHYTQFMVYDLDGDGKAELVCKTADGTKDGVGVYIGNSSANYVTSSGTIMSGPEYLTVFNGLTGAAIHTVDYDPPRTILVHSGPEDNNANWGDNYGNRSERYLACVAYLDGIHPSVVMCRGYYTHIFLTAYTFNGSELIKGASFSTKDYSTSLHYKAQGNHSVSVTDVDGDGRDEIIYGSLTLNSDLTPRYSTRMEHGDAQHTGDLDPDRPGLEIFGVHEHTQTGILGYEMHDASTGEILWGTFTGTDVGRGMSADIDPRYPGSECWVADNGSANLFSAKGEVIGSTKPSQINFAIWWDGDLGRELLGGGGSSNGSTPRIVKWNYTTGTGTTTTLSGTTTNNGTKDNVMLQADLFGDWREEVIARESDSSAMRTYSTTAVSNSRFFTLMHNPQYRLSIAWQNVGYNQPPHTSYRLGYDMTIPRQPNISAAP
jgi:rhamnogalacturonan endolyase